MENEELHRAFFYKLTRDFCNMIKTKLLWKIKYQSDVEQKSSSFTRFDICQSDPRDSM